MPEMRLHRSFLLAQEAAPLALYRMSPSVLGDGGDADAPDASAAAGMGARDLPDRVLAELVRQFRERRVLSTRSGGRGSTAAPRLHNPYFGAEKSSAARISGQTKAPHLVLATAT